MAASFLRPHMGKGGSFTPVTLACPVREPRSPESVHPPAAGVVELVGFSKAWLAGAKGFEAPILVTGGAGYIGSHMTLMLLERGFDVVIVDNLSRSNMLSVRVLQAEACKLERSLAFANLDLGSYDQLQMLLKRVKPKAVLHFAGNAYASESMEKPLLYFQNVTENSLNLLRAMASARVGKIIFSSSCATYGNPSKEQVPVTEMLEQKPISVYGQSKLMAERMIAAWVGLGAAGTGTARCATIFRYFNVYGADLQSRLGPGLRGPDLMQYSRLPDALMEAALGLRKSVPIFGADLATRDGTAERDYIHVWDLVGAHMDALAAMLAKSVQGKQCTSDVYNLGTGTPVSVQQMLTAVKALFPEANFTVDVKPPRLGDPVSIYANPSKALAELGWQASMKNTTKALETSALYLRKHAAYFRLDKRAKAPPSSGASSTWQGPGAAPAAPRPTPTPPTPLTSATWTPAPSTPGELYRSRYRDPGNPYQAGDMPNATLTSTPWVVHRFSDPSASPRICVQVITIPTVTGGYLTKTFHLLREYCRRHGYDLYALTDKLGEKRVASWLKIRSAQAIIRSNTGCDYLFWIDGDAVIMNMTFELETVIGYNGNKDVDVVVSGDTVAVNAAMGLWKMTAWNWQFLEDMWNVGDVKLWETGAINILIANCTPTDSSAKKNACYSHSDRGWVDKSFAPHLKLAEPWAINYLLVNKSLVDHLVWVPKRLINSYPKGLFGGQLEKTTGTDFLAHFVSGAGKGMMDDWWKASMTKNNITELPVDLFGPTATTRPPRVLRI
ncbi:unnamed protein product [Symbiodinium sp. CCMP2456]|nr:unnamed protein product [Symbiodinium sp. CCMP2456]